MEMVISPTECCFWTTPIKDWQVLSVSGFVLIYPTTVSIILVPRSESLLYLSGETGPSKYYIRFIGLTLNIAELRMGRKYEGSESV
jgi:hypothetical protein